MTRRRVSTEEEFAKAMKDDTVDEVEITGSMKDKMLKVRARGKITWGIVAGSFAVAGAVILTSPTTGGLSSILSLPALAPAVGVLGTTLVAFLVKLIIAFGSIGILTQLRDGIIIEETPYSAIFKKRR